VLEDLDRGDIAGQHVDLVERCVAGAVVRATHPVLGGLRRVVIDIDATRLGAVAA
jgi:hypothetical protein